MQIRFRASDFGPVAKIKLSRAKSKQACAEMMLGLFLFERSEFLIATCKKKKTDRLSDVCTHNLLVLVWKNCLGSSVGYQRAPGWF